MARRPSRPTVLDPGLPFTDTEQEPLIGTFVGIDGIHKLDTQPTLLDALAEQTGRTHP